MTIAARNRFIRLATLASATLFVSAFAALAYVIVNGLHLPIGTRAMASLNAFKLTAPSALAAAAAIPVMPLFSALCLVYVLFAFEKTQTIEITFFAAAAFALSLESLRMAIPIGSAIPLLAVDPVLVSRAALFARVFIALALLASVIFTTGQTSQQIGASVFLLAFFSFSLVSAIPFNSARLASSNVILPGFSGMITAFIAVTSCLTILSYVLQGASRSSSEYSLAGLNLAVFMCGYGLLSICDSWAFLAAGTALLFLGGWRYLNLIHRYYLWQ